MVREYTTSCSAKVLNTIGKRIVNQGQEDAFFIADLQEVDLLYRQWQDAFPAIRPFYAVKCNPDSRVISTLARCGAGFDCASLREMQLVLGLGVAPERIIFANPCKMESHILFAKEHGVKRLTFDNFNEIEQLSRLYPEAELVLRIATDDKDSAWKLSNKFGSPISQVPSLLEEAKRKELNVIGISFHVGCECGDPQAYEDAIQNAARAFDLAAQLGFKPSLLDIGGGFHGRHTKSKAPLNAISAVIKDSLAKHLSNYDHLEVISEPGRYFVESAFTLATRVYSKRPAYEHSPPMYYLNDGVFGSLNGKLYGEAPPGFQVFRVIDSALEEVSSEPVTVSHLWGPTCDSYDLVLENFPLPDLLIGDWLIFPNLGAYTLAIATQFNGHLPATIFYCD